RRLIRPPEPPAGESADHDRSASGANSPRPTRRRLDDLEPSRYSEGAPGAVALTSVDPVKLLVYAALINGLLATPFLVLVMLISDDHTTMGDYTNRGLARIFGWTTALLMAASAIAYLILTYG